MDERLITQALQDKARKDIPEDMDMFPEIQSQLGRVSRRAARSRASWLAIAIVVMLAMSIVAYGAARLLQTRSDPGLQGASEADLITVLNLEQTHEGVTVVLDYAYADSNRLSLAYHMDGEAPNGTDYRFSTEKITDSQGHEFTAPMFGGGGGGGGGSSDSDMHSYSQSQNASYDLWTLDNLPDEFDMRVEIGVDRLTYPTPSAPVENAVPVEPVSTEPIGPFVFEFRLPVIRGQAVTLGQSASANDVTLTLENLVIAPSMTRGALCFAPPEAGDRYFPLISLTIDGEPVPLEPEQSFEPDEERPGCHFLRIPYSLYDRPGTWVLTVDRLGAYLPVSTASGSNGTTQDYTITGDAEYLARARAKLEPGLAAHDIELSEADGSLTFSLPLDDAIDLREINQLVADATREYLTGPWVFTFEVPPAP
jgi:hypothetical protein